MRSAFAAAAAITALIAFVAPASAAINMYQFNLDGTTGSALPAGPYGTVSLNDNNNTTSWHFDIQLAPDFYFNDSKAFQAFDLLLSGTSISFSNITTGFTSTGPGDFTAPSIVTNGDSTHFNYALLCASLCAGGNPDGKINFLSFDLTGTGLDLGSISDTNNHPGLPIFFGADIAYEGGPSVITGNIGATLIGGVPEPSTWAMFILGFGFVGTMLRAARTRQKVTAA